MKRLKVFYSYSHKDQKLLEKLEAHMASLRRSQAVETWQDGLITAGSDWRAAIGKALDEADVILLLLSADFLNSDFCQSIELKRAVERYQDDQTLIIPIKLRPCDIQGTVLESLQWIPRGSKAVTEWPNRDRAFVDIVERIRTALSAFQPAKGPPPSVTQTVERPVQAALHMILGPNEFQSPMLLQTLLKRAHAVARLELMQKPLLSGILVQSEHFLGASAASPVSILTVADSGQESPSSAFFELADVRVELAPPIWRGGDFERGRGAQLLPVSGLPSRIEPCPLGDLSTASPGEAVFVVSYPLGGPLAFSLRNTRLVSVDDTFVHYIASTQPGSSGGPVLDESGHLIAIHHRRNVDGSKSGQSIDAILRTARES
jgi:hypothetical protein